MDAPWTGSSPRYPAEKILVLNLPGVEIGSTIEIQATSHMKNKPFFSDIMPFRSSSPIKKISYKISVPKETAIKIIRKNLNDIIEKRTVSSEHITYEWKGENQKALKKEASLPPSWTFLPTVILSAGNWKEYSEQLNKRFAEASKIQPKIKLLVKKIVTDQNNIDNKIISIRDYVAKNIRKSGPSFTEMPLSSISTALETLSDGYGNSADQAILLYSLLKTAKLSPAFVLASNYPADIKQITEPILKSPQRSLFNKVLVAVKTEKGNTVYLNDTDEYSILGTTGNEYNLGLSLKTVTPITIKPLKNKSNKISFDYRIELDNNGDATLKITKKYFGNYFGLFNKLFTELRPEERDRYYQSSVASISQSAEPLSTLLTDFKNYPGTEHFSVKISNYGVINNNYYYFKTPLRLNNIFNLGKDKRFYPYYQEGRINSIYNINVMLPKNFGKEIITPQEERVIFPNNSGKIDLKPSFGEKITGQWNEKVNIKIQPSIFNPEQYNEILKVNERISSPSTHTILLKKKALNIK